MALAVGIAVVGRDGDYLIRRRPVAPGSPMPGVWEFPGGKCEPGESPEQTAVRECLEESGLVVTTQGLLYRVVHRYPHGEVDLHYYDCVCVDDPQAIDPNSGFRWTPAADLPNCRFPDANEPVIALLAERVASARSAQV